MKLTKTSIAAIAMLAFCASPAAAESVMSPHCLEIVARPVETADARFDGFDRQAALLSNPFIGKIKFPCTSIGEGITLRTVPFPSNDWLRASTLAGSILTGATQASLETGIRACTLKVEKERAIIGDQAEPFHMAVQHTAGITCLPTLTWRDRSTPIPDNFRAPVRFDKDAGGSKK